MQVYEKRFIFEDYFLPILHPYMKSMFKIIPILALLFTASVSKVFGQIPPEAYAYFSISYTSSVDDSLHACQTLLYVHHSATDGYDANTFDSQNASTPSEIAPNIMTLVPNPTGGWVKLAQNGYGYPFVACDFIPLGFMLPIDTTYTLNVDYITGFDSIHVFINLVDSLTGITVPFDSVNQTYTFLGHHTDSIWGRFYINMCYDTVTVGIKDEAQNAQNCSDSYWKKVFTARMSDTKVEVLNLIGQSLYEGSQPDFVHFNAESKFPSQPLIIKTVNADGVCSRKIIIP